MAERKYDKWFYGDSLVKLREKLPILTNFE